MARLLGCAPSKVSRLEHGRQTASADDVSAWVRAVGGPPALRDDLLTDLQAVRFEYATWQRQLRVGIAKRQRENVPLERSALLLRSFAPQMVPGLLQTAEYSRHVFGRLVSLHGTPNDIEAGVRERLRRQEVLYDHTKQFRFLLTEAALRYRICPPAVLRGQLDRLLGLMELENVHLAVLPFTAVLPVVPSHGFFMLDDKLVLVELTSAELAFRDPDEVALYADVFKRMWEVAELEDAAAIVRQALSGL